MLADLALVTYEKPIDTSEDVLASGLKVYALDGSLLSQTLRDSERPVLNAIYENQLVGMGGLYNRASETPEETKVRETSVKEGKAIQIGSAMFTARDPTSRYV